MFPEKERNKHIYKTNISLCSESVSPKSIKIIFLYDIILLLLNEFCDFWVNCSMISAYL